MPCFRFRPKLKLFNSRHSSNIQVVEEEKSFGCILFKNISLQISSFSMITKKIVPAPQHCDLGSEGAVMARLIHPLLLKVIHFAVNKYFLINKLIFRNVNGRFLTLSFNPKLLTATSLSGYTDAKVSFSLRQVLRFRQTVVK